MPIQIEQLESQYLYYIFSGQVTPADLDELFIAEEPYFAALPADGCIGLIMDLSALDTIASQLFPQLQRLRLVRDARACVVVVVGANPYLRALAMSLGLTASPHDFIFRRTVDEALAVLQSHPRLQPPPSVGGT